VEVYYSGYGFIYDSFHDEENYSECSDTIAFLRKVSQHKHDGQFVLPPHIIESLKVIGSTMVDFLLYENEPEVIPVPLYGVGVFAKTARLYLSDNEGNLCPIKIQNAGGVFEDKQSGNRLKLLSDGELPDGGEVVEMNTMKALAVMAWLLAESQSQYRKGANKKPNCASIKQAVMERAEAANIDKTGLVSLEKKISEALRLFNEDNHDFR
jgi:hypothetical protein